MKRRQPEEEEEEGKRNIKDTMKKERRRKRIKNIEKTQNLQGKKMPFKIIGFSSLKSYFRQFKWKILALFSI